MAFAIGQPEAIHPRAPRRSQRVATRTSHTAWCRTMTTTPILALEAVAERDIDLLLLEELTVSNNFARWFISRTFPSDTVLNEVSSARHSVSDPSGESDLELVFVDARGRRLGLLIEDKVSAPAQPDQADRYRQRASRGVEAGSWAEARTCIVAPKRYLELSEDAQRYDASISYEDVVSWFEQTATNDPRAKYRAEIVTAALDQARRGYTKVRDEAVTAFWRKYWVDVDDLFPELEMQDPGDRSAQATWVVFRPKTLAPPRTLNHKLTMGVVDLNTEYPAARVPELGTAWTRFLAPDMSVVATGKSLSVRVTITQLDIQADYGQQVSVARQGMRAAYRLLYLSRALVAPA
jgi:hypothetical protein